MSYRAIPRAIGEYVWARPGVCVMPGSYFAFKNEY
jgi:hypothetical protein